MHEFDVLAGSGLEKSLSGRISGRLETKGAFNRLRVGSTPTVRSERRSHGMDLNVVARLIEFGRRLGSKFRIRQESEMTAYQHRLDIKIASLAAESRLIRKKEKRQKGRGFGSPPDKERLSVFRDLQRHRKMVVRAHARRALLAKAFLRGMPYHRVEQKCRVKPDSKFLAKEVSTFCDRTILEDEVVNWLRSGEDPVKESVVA